MSVIKTVWYTSVIKFCLVIKLTGSCYSTEMSMFYIPSELCQMYLSQMTLYMSRWTVPESRPVNKIPTRSSQRDLINPLFTISWIHGLATYVMICNIILTIFFYPSRGLAVSSKNRICLVSSKSLSICVLAKTWWWSDDAMHRVV